jgi:molecular chaperone DnaK
MSIAVGIDLGTTNTVVGAVRDGRAVTLADEGGRRLIPSIVSFHPSGKVVVGDAAKERRIVDPGNTIYSIKRLIGRTWDSDEVQRARRTLPFELVEGQKQAVCILARGEQYTLPEISAFVLRRAKAIAEAALGQSVDRAVITVPANFNDLQRGATKLAGRLAGLEVLRILNEPTAAALAYGQQSAPASTTPGQPRPTECLAVYDLGGGTFDITLLDLSGNVFEVLATGGDTSLGGDDIDQVIAEQMAQTILQTHQVDPRADPSARATLRQRAEVLKVELSGREAAQIDLHDVTRKDGGGFPATTFRMTRADLEKLALPLIDRTLETCRFSIETIGLKVHEVERIILVGGSTRMPLVVRKVEEFFKRPATGRVNPDEVVALGAAIQAAALNRLSRKKAAASAAVQEKTPSPPGPLGRPSMTQRAAPAPPVAPTRAPVASASPTLVGVPHVPAPQGGASHIAPQAWVPPVSQPQASTAQASPPQVRPPAPPPQARAAAASPPGRPPPPPLPGRASRVIVEVPPPPEWLGQAPPPADLEVLPPPSAPPPAFEDEPTLPKGDAVLISTDGSPFTFELELPPAPSPSRVGLLPVSPPPPKPAGAAPPVPKRPPPPVPTRTPSMAGVAVPPLPAGPSPSQGPWSTGITRSPSYPEPSLSSRPPETTLSGRPSENTLSGRSMSGRPSPLLIDVTPISLGVETAGGYCDMLISANTPVPCDRTRIFRTASDGQTTVSVKVAQGGSQVFAENTYLGDLELTELASAPRGEAKVAVTFEIDADGILNVRAKDVASGRETAARMLLQGTQSEAGDVEVMIARQDRHALG